MAVTTTKSAVRSRIAPAALGILGCLAGALAFNFLLFRASGSPFVWIGLVSATVISLAIAVPLFLSLAFNRRELARLKQKLNQVASADNLTSCLDGAVFTALVDSFRGRAGVTAGKRHGALLVIDVDHFKDVNQRFGRSWGDEALRVISDVIRASVRSGDLVGRLGGEEFGVFLPGAHRDNANDVAERIREVISDTLFEPGGERCLLTVSVGGVVFEDQLMFDELFGTAEQELLSAKNGGRNRTALRVMSSIPSNENRGVVRTSA